jgi:hypothetical protein
MDCSATEDYECVHLLCYCDPNTGLHQLVMDMQYVFVE